MDIFIKRILGLLGLELGKLQYLFGHQGLLVTGLIIQVSMIFTVFSGDLKLQMENGSILIVIVSISMCLKSK